jgi:hypothetical protein
MTSRERTRRRRSPFEPRPFRDLWRQLERVAGLINPFLIILAIGLMILDLSCFTALHLGPVRSIAPPASLSGSPPRAR